MFYVGLDLGQSRDHSAIAVVEREEIKRPFAVQHSETLLVRYVERVPLGTPYPRVVSRVRQILHSAEIERGRSCLVVDGTGVGAPVVEMLRGAQLGCEVEAVTITGGEREHLTKGAGWSVPKQDLISGVQVLLEKRDLRIAAGMREAGALRRELQDMRASVSRSGRIRMGAEGAGEHDDLVIALALACWRAKRKQLTFGTQRLPGI